MQETVIGDSNNWYVYCNNSAQGFAFTANSVITCKYSQEGSRKAELLLLFTANVIKLSRTRLT